MRSFWNYLSTQSPQRAVRFSCGCLLFVFCAQYVLHPAIYITSVWFVFVCLKRSVLVLCSVLAENLPSSCHVEGRHFGSTSTVRSTLAFRCYHFTESSLVATTDDVFHVSDRFPVVALLMATVYIFIFRLCGSFGNPCCWELVFTIKTRKILGTR